jgi:hypothetical protein
MQRPCRLTMQADHAGCPMTEKPLNVRPAEIAKMKIKLAPSYLATSAPNHELQRERVSRERTELYDILQCRENPTNRSRKQCAPNNWHYTGRRRKRLQTGSSREFRTRLSTLKTLSMFRASRWRYMTIIKPFRENVCLRDDGFGQDFEHNLFIQFCVCTLFIRLLERSDGTD